ncbi:PE-PGRS family protein [Streptomyces halobius]|uniref:PE-PGRS family protein n=1 Tax=Streptomyces halobius TaxID=2879846 RepID=A0ABY4MGR6_9ACTN|nr:PE-PGRS family protein [Streptomyces halobius]UQA96994.1 PE-PGRS family protein [Streptomyces halobius]
MDAGDVLRGLRAAVFAAVCVLLTALGHTLMSDTPLPGWMLLVAGLGTTAVAWCFAGRERGPMLVGLLTVGTQAALHSAFSFGQAVTDSGGGRLSLMREWANTWLCGAEGMPSARLEQFQQVHQTQQIHQVQQLGPMDQMPGMSHAMHGSGSGSGMLAAHLLVALLSAWWLWGGERAAFRLVRTVSARLFAPLVLILRIVLPEAPPAVRASRKEPRHAARTLLLAHAISLRGPPRGPAVV